MSASGMPTGVDVPSGRSEELGVAELGALVRSGRASASEVMRRSIARADELDAMLGVYVSRFDESALAVAHAVDDAVARGIDPGPLAGVPVSVKDLIATREGPTTGQSLVHDENWWRGRDAEVVARVRRAGAIITGKTTLAEHAMGRIDPAMPFPIPRNPWDVDRWPGGSSAGAAAGIAARIVPAGLGTDTTGSVRIPAAMCGVTGLRTTLGLVPRAGCLPASPALDAIGPLARGARDCAALLAAMVPEHAAGADGTSAALWRSDLTGTTIGVPWSLLTDSARGIPADCLETFEAATAELVGRGAMIRPFEWPEFDALLRATMSIAISEVYRGHADSLRDRWHDYGRSFRRVAALGAFVPAEAYAAAESAAKDATASVARRMLAFDAVLTPTWPSGAPRYGSGGGMPEDDLNLTAVWSVTGLPALAFPMGFDHSGLPLSAQLVGRGGAELALLEIADVYQSGTDWHLRLPRLDPRLRPEPVPDLDERVPSSEAIHERDAGGHVASVAVVLERARLPVDHADLVAIAGAAERILEPAVVAQTVPVDIPEGPDPLDDEPHDPPTTMKES